MHSIRNWYVGMNIRCVSPFQSLADPIEFSESTHPPDRRLGTHLYYHPTGLSHYDVFLNEECRSSRPCLRRANIRVQVLPCNNFPTRVHRVPHETMQGPSRGRMGASSPERSVEENPQKAFSRSYQHLDATSFTNTKKPKASQRK